MRRYWRDVREAFEAFRPEIDEIIDCGSGGVVTRTTVRGRGRDSGIEIQAEGAMRFRFRDDRIISGKLFQTAAQALEARAGDHVAVTSAPSPSASRTASGRCR